jgi:hypothetical protein
MSSPTTVDPQLWSSLVDDLLSTVDAGPTSQHTDALTLGSQRAAIVETAAIGPDPATGLDQVLATISTEAVDATDGTLLGHISARIRAEEHRASERLDAALDQYEADFRRLRRPRVAVAGILNWIMALLVAGIVGLLTIGGGIAEHVGIVHWAASTRTTVGVVLAILALTAAGVAMAAALRGRGESQRRAWITVGATLGSGLAVGLLNRPTRWQLDGPFGTVRVGEALLALTVVSVLVEVLVFTAIEKTSRGRAATRVTGVALIVYVTLVTIGAVARDAGWYVLVDRNVMRSVTLRIAGLLFVVAVADLLIIATLRVRERLVASRAASRLVRSAHAARHIAGEIPRLRAALSQYHQTAVAVDRVVWWPFGRPTPKTHADVSDRNVAMPALKMQVFPYSFSDRGLAAVTARIRRKIAEAGWLQRQYGVAVEAFRPEFAAQTGRDLDAVATRRPETDASTEQVSRTRFAASLFNGDFDEDLRAAGSSLALDDVLEQYFQRADGTVARASVDSGVTTFADNLVAGNQPPLPADLFKKMSLPTATDERTRYTTTIWWPATAVRMPRTAAALHESGINHGRPHEMVLSFIRTDWSMVFALHRLPIAPRHTASLSALSPDLEYDLAM